jgi:hypothetical protein
LKEDATRKADEALKHLEADADDDDAGKKMMKQMHP